ncbi:MAG: UbiD family decarboxylase [Candidatus Diapherotrites archaeon]|mgnify:CR=1 FL=1|nr:UbiD family decarboxylase [Candidatus Diapherotrites archaeon]MBT4597276.1 UbiD family decarboxylase [Candidatus Diapherotrites archaeon]
MSIREFVENNVETKIAKDVSKNLEISGIVHSTGDEMIVFDNVKESKNKVAVNVFASKDKVAKYLGCEIKDLVPKMINALENPSEPALVETTDHEEQEIDLNKLPILTHTGADGGPYVSSGLIIVKDEELGQNVCFHRGMVFDKNRMALRILERNTMEILKKNGGEVKAAYCIGCGGETLLAAAMAPPIGVNELTIANTLNPIKVVKAKTFDAVLPADAEIIMEGTLSINEKHSEGPFVDLTETPDIVRQEPIFTIEKIYTRPNYIYHALLPGGFEHKILMGMPREPTVFSEVKKAGIDIKDVSVNPGGTSWLHVLIKINKQSDEDGKKTIEAGMKGHTSAKHFFIVDKDIDIYNPLEVEWAMATRFQADKDLYTFPGEKGSSLDPSGDPETRKTCKAGFDYTMPIDKIKHMTKQPFPKFNIEEYR